MSKSSELASQVKQLKQCGKMLIGIADSLSQLFSSDEEKQTTISIKISSKENKT